MFDETEIPRYHDSQLKAGFVWADGIRNFQLTQDTISKTKRP